jgi:hypothetical protein
MLKILIAVTMAAACVAGGEGAAVQAVAGPGGVTVTVRAEGQLAVSWTPDAAAAATQYHVLRSAGGGAFTFLDSVTGAPPATSYIDTGLAGGASYCYAIQSVYADGSASDPGGSTCAVATGGGAPAGPTITGTMMAGNNNNWTTAGFGTASTIRIATGSGFPFLTGLSGGVDGRTVTLVMASAGDPLTITRLDGSSQAANQLLLPLPVGAPYLQMTAVDQAITLAYDGVASKWRLVSKNF